MHAGVRVTWEGDFDGLHSLAMVNRAVCSELVERGYDLGLIRDGADAVSHAGEPQLLNQRLAERLGRGPEEGPGAGARATSLAAAA